MTLRYGSVCSGIESASVAWEPMGMKAAWFSELEPFPCAVLAHHWPTVPNLGDMNLIPMMLRSGMLEAPDVLVGGTPCQAFSVAGLRRSMDDDRGQLTLKYVEILNEIDNQRPTNDECVCVWENVPGVLSTKDNAFGCFLGELAGSGIELQPGEKPAVGKSTGLWAWDKSGQFHRARWPNAGTVHGPRRSIAWRVLDAQHFGLAQRRKRVFVVASARDGFDPAAVLFEPEGVRRDSAPSRETGQGVAGSASAGIAGDVVGTLDTQCGFQQQAFQTVARDIEEGALQVVHGTQDPCVNTELGHTIGRNNGAENVLCIQGSMIGRSEKNGPQGQGINKNISFTLNATDRHAVTPIHDKATRHAGCTGIGSGNGLGVGAETDPMFTLTTGDKHAVAQERVRKLTPVECERLQGFPDNHTLLPYGTRQRVDDEMRQYYSAHLGRELTQDEQRLMCSDGPRYNAIGNSKAVPCIEFVGRRLRDYLA